MDTQTFNQPGPGRFSPPATVPPLPTHLPDPYKKGTTFESFEAARDALLQWTVARGLSYKVERAQKHRYIIKCRSKSCPFKLRISHNKKPPEIKTTVSIPHICPLETHYDWQPSKSMKYLQHRHQNTFNNDHTIKPRQIIALEQAYIYAKLRWDNTMQQ
jgi:hypothetical protein